MGASWSTSDSSIATVSGGNVTAVASGQVNIGASAFIAIDGQACQGGPDDINGNPPQCPIMRDIGGDATVRVAPRGVPDHLIVQSDHTIFEDCPSHTAKRTIIYGIMGRTVRTVP